MAPPKKEEHGSVVDGLRAIYQDAAALALAPDAGQYMQAIQQLQQGLLKLIQGITQQKAQQAAMMQQQQAAQAAGMHPGMAPGGQPPQPGGQPGMPPGMPGKGTPGGPPAQGSPGMAMPNPDELRRVLAAQGQGG